MTCSESPTLVDALRRYRITLAADQIELLDRYCKLLWQWNEKLNLTRHTDYDTFVARDVVDSLRLASLLKDGEEVLDVGSGGGVPGVVVAVTRPDLEIALSESVGKKATALRTIVDALDLAVAVHPCRAEQLLEDLRFDTLTARAVGPLRKILKWFEPHWSNIGRLLLIKGPRWVDERKEARHLGLLGRLELRCVARYPMPGTESESVILQLWPKGRTPPA